MHALDEVDGGCLSGLQPRRSGDERRRGQIAGLPGAKIAPDLLEAALRGQERLDPAIPATEEALEHLLLLLRGEEFVAAGLLQIYAQDVLGGPIRTPSALSDPGPFLSARKHSSCHELVHVGGP